MTNAIETIRGLLEQLENETGRFERAALWDEIKCAVEDAENANLEAEEEAA